MRSAAKRRKGAIRGGALHSGEGSRAAGIMDAVNIKGPSPSKRAAKRLRCVDNDGSGELGGELPPEVWAGIFECESRAVAYCPPSFGTIMSDHHTY